MQSLCSKFLIPSPVEAHLPFAMGQRYKNNTADPRANSTTSPSVHHEPATHLLGQVASAVRRVHYLVVENGEVEGQTQADGVSGGQLREGNVRGSLVCGKRLVGGSLALI